MLFRSGHTREDLVTRDISDSHNRTPSSDLDFSAGIAFTNSIWRHLGISVHPSSYTGHFIMVVSFGRATFKLDDLSVSTALEAALGGNSDKFKVSTLSDRTFSFNVSCKQVGFRIFNLGSFTCKHFKCFFHLWGRGGPNWVKEFKSWQKEEKEEWLSYSRRCWEFYFHMICGWHGSE